MPTLSGPFAFTENRGPNSAGFSTGWTLQLGATVQDPLGVPSNIVLAEARNTTTSVVTTLPFQNIGPIFTGLYNSLTPYLGETGVWEITVTNLQSETDTILTNDLDDPHLIPLATNLAASGPALAPLITWDPVLFDHDNDPSTPDTEVDQYRIRLINSVFNQFFRSGPIAGNSFLVPMNLITPGVTHIRLEARDFDGGFLENRSSTFLRYSVPEPATYGLLLAGLLILSMSARRRSWSG